MLLIFSGTWRIRTATNFQDSHSEAVHEATAGLGKSEENPCDHDCMLDEGLGLVCRLCNVVCVEIKHIFPQMVGPTKAISTSFHCFHF